MADGKAIAPRARAILTPDAAPLPHDQWMSCYTAVAAACNAGKPQAVFELLARELSAAVDAVSSRLSGLIEFELLACYDTEYLRFVHALSSLHSLSVP